MAVNKNNNRSMFLYTALIFVVAILLIVLSFFGEANLERNQPAIKGTMEPAKQLNTSISQRAAVLSEENRILLEENQKLKDEIASLKEKQEAVDTLFSAMTYMSTNDKVNAQNELNKIDTELLSEAQMSVYETINQFVEQQ